MSMGKYQDGDTLIAMTVALYSLERLNPPGGLYPQGEEELPFHHRQTDSCLGWV
jgi:hypothetical protein